MILIHPIFRVFASVAAVVLLVSLAACSTGPTAVRREVSTGPAATGNPASILFIGNSYSFEVPKVLQRVAAENGVKVRVAQVTNGGWTLAQHAENEKTLAKIREGGWDVVVIQEQSRIPSLAGSRDRVMFPQVRKLAEEARAQGAKPVLYQTWGYRDGDKRRPGNDDFQAMTRRLREGYQGAARAAGGLTVVPVGDAWEKEFAAGRGDLLFQPDGSHPTAHGDEVTARAFFETLFPQAAKAR